MTPAALTSFGRDFREIEMIDVVHREPLNAADETGQVRQHVRDLGRWTADQQTLPPERDFAFHVGIVWKPERLSFRNHTRVRDGNRNDLLSAVSLSTFKRISCALRT